MTGRTFSAFEAAVLTTTYTLPPSICQDADSILLEVTTAGFSGTLDFQGAINNVLGQSPAYKVLPYIDAVGAGPYANTVTQKSFTTDTGTIWIILPIIAELMQIVMTRSAGSITIRGITRGPVGLDTA